MTSNLPRWAFNSLALVTFVGIGGLQMRGVDLGWVTSYGADFLLPVVLYFSLRQGTTLLNRNRPIGARAAFLLVLAGCALWEWSQAHDFAGTPLVIARGTFDPLDFAAYLLGLIAAVALDEYIERRNPVRGGFAKL